MTEAAVNTPAATPPPAPAGPDIEAITRQVTEAAVKAAEAASAKQADAIATKTRKDIAQALNGGEQVDPSKKFLEQFLTDPTRAFYNTKEMAKSELREENAAIANQQKVQRTVLTPFVEEYPALATGKKLAMVEKITEQHQNEGMSYADALKQACSDTVKDLGLKSVSEMQRDGEINAAGLPNGGGSFGGGSSKFDDKKSSLDFLQGMKEKAAAIRTRK